MLFIVFWFYNTLYFIPLWFALNQARGRKPEIVQVIAPYQATSTEQLDLQRGQLIMIRKKTETGWWEGELQVNLTFFCVKFDTGHSLIFTFFVFLFFRHEARRGRSVGSLPRTWSLWRAAAIAALRYLTAIKTHRLIPMLVSYTPSEFGRVKKVR